MEEALSDSIRRHALATATPGRLAGKSIAIDGRYLARTGMGIHRYVAGVVDVLSTAGAHVTVLTSPAYPVPPRPHITVQQIGGSRQMTWEQVHLRRHLAGHRYDLYWAPANGGVPLFATRRQRIIVTEHDLIPLLLPAAWFPRSLLWGVAYFVQLATAMVRADVVVAPSAYSASVVRRWLRRQAEVVSPVVALPELRASREDRRADRQPPYLLYHGGIGRRKRVDSAIRACAALRDRGHEYQLVLLGRGYEAYDDEISKHGMNDLIVRPGHVSEAERDQWVAGAFAVLYPSEMEGFGLPLLEAMAQGVPVVTAPNSSLVEVGGNGALYADPRVPSDIAARVIDLEGSRRRERAITNGLKQAAKYRDGTSQKRMLDFVCRQLDSA